MSRFKKGDTVWKGRGKHERKMIVAKVIDNPLLPVYQYSFEAPNDGYACGEQSIREEQYGRDLKISECFKKDAESLEDDSAININTISSAKRLPVRMEEHGMEMIFSKSNLFFRPDIFLCEWLRDYADGRLIIDVGCGQGHLVNMLKRTKAKAIGIEPLIDKQAWIQWRIQHDGGIPDVNEILQGTVQQHKNLISGLGKNNKAMLVFARPCHSNFVEEGIYNMPEGMEALYITIPENLTLYNDLGQFKNQAVLLKHKGRSEDNEVIYSITR